MTRSGTTYSGRARPTRHSEVSATLARSRLGVGSVVFFVLAAAAPFTVIAAGATTAFAVTGITAIPVSYLVAAGVLAVFAVGFVAMSRHVVNAGAFYAYISQGLGKAPGVAAAMVALVAYNAMQVGLYGAVGVVAAAVAGQVGATAPWWACALVAWLVIAVLGLLRVDINGRLLGFLLLAEIAVVVVYDAAMLAHPAGGSVDVATLAPEQLLDPEVAGILVVAITGYIGFEATVVFSEETRDPRRTVARATYLAVATTGLLYGLSAWAMTVATGPNNIVPAARAHGTELMFTLVAPHVGRVLVDAGHVLFLTSLFAALLAFHGTVARYMFALGREGVLPAAVGRTHLRTGAPVVGSLLQSGLALALVVGYAIAGADPQVHLFGWLTSVGGLGVLILMTATCAAVIRFFAHDRHGENAWRRIWAPLTAGIILTATALVTITQFGALLGVDPGSQLGWAFPAAYGAAAIVGLVWAVFLRVRRPMVWAVIGLGANSLTASIPHPNPANPAPDRQPHAAVPAAQHAATP
jgi:amino acid transporter